MIATCHKTGDMELGKEPHEIKEDVLAEFSWTEPKTVESMLAEDS